MRKLFLLLALSAAGCSDAAPTQARRGHEVFGPCAQALAAGLFAEEKAKDPGAAARLLKESGAADEAAFLALSAREILVRYGVVLALTQAQGAEFAAGRFDDPGNRKRVEETLAGIQKAGLALPETARYAIDQVRKGAWSGLNLEFAARLLWSEAARPR